MLVNKLQNQAEEETSKLINKLQNNIVYDFKTRQLLLESMKKNIINVLNLKNVAPERMIAYHMTLYYKKMNYEQKFAFLQQVATETSCSPEQVDQYFMTRFYTERCGKMLERFRMQMTDVISKNDYWMKITEGELAAELQGEKEELKKISIQEKFRAEMLEAAKAATTGEKKHWRVIAKAAESEAATVGTEANSIPPGHDSEHGKEVGESGAENGPKEQLLTTKTAGTTHGTIEPAEAAATATICNNNPSGNIQRQYIEKYTELLCLFNQQKELAIQQYQNIFQKVQQYKQTHENQLESCKQQREEIADQLSKFSIDKNII